LIENVALQTAENLYFIAGVHANILDRMFHIYSNTTGYG